MAMWRVAQEIGDGHFAAGDQRSNGSEHAKGDEQTAEELDHPGGEHQGNVEHLRAPENAKKLLRAVAGKQEAGHQAHQAVKMVGVSVQGWHHLASLSLGLSLNKACATKGECTGLKTRRYNEDAGLKAAATEEQESCKGLPSGDVECRDGSAVDYPEAVPRIFAVLALALERISKPRPFLGARAEVRVSICVLL
jgi:hypothetical protein